MTIAKNAVSWRASPVFITATVTVGFFCRESLVLLFPRKKKKKGKCNSGAADRETLDLYLYSFIVPIIPYMLVERIQIDPANVQAVTSALLANYALVCLISSPIVGHYADKTTDRKTPLLIALAIELASAVTIARTTNCELLLKAAVLQSFRLDTDFIFRISVLVLFIARTFGAISGMMLWIIGFSTLAENIEKRHMGTASGVVSGAVAAGMLAGPAVSGFFVEKVGYWSAWSLCFGLVSSLLVPLM